MSEIVRDVTHVVAERLRKMTSRPPPNRFWDHFSACVTMLWSLRKMKHLRLGQLLGIVLSRDVKADDIRHNLNIAWYSFEADRRRGVDERTAFENQLGPVMMAAERSYRLSRMEDDQLSHLTEDYVMSTQNHCGSK